MQLGGGQEAKSTVEGDSLLQDREYERAEAGGHQPENV